MLPLRWWPHSQVPQLWPGNVQRQAGLSLGVCEDIHVQEGSSKGVFGAKVVRLKVAISSVPVLCVHTNSCAYFCPRMPWLVSCPSSAPSSVSFSVMVINSNTR